MTPSTLRITDEPRFPAGRVAALYAAVEVNDAIDLDAPPPATIDRDHDGDRLLRCYRLCRQLWREGRDRAGLRLMAWRMMRHRDLSAADRIRFRHARARYKQLRFAHANMDAGHAYPPLFHWTTALMGHLQDDLKNRRGAAVLARAMLLRLMLAALPDALARREVDRLRPSTPADHRAYVSAQIGFIRDSLAHGTVTGHEFHEIRKIVSRQASFHAALVTLHPSPEHDATFRYLAAVNGLMGRLHDTLVERRISGEQDYRAERFAFPPEIGGRLRTLVALFGEA